MDEDSVSVTQTEPESLIKGPDLCRNFNDIGTGKSQKEKANWFCIAFSFVMFLGFTINLINRIQKITVSNFENNVLSAVLLSIQLLTVFIMFFHCQRCNGGVGFWIVIAINLLSFVIFNAILQDKNNYQK
jgi:hypothetical protein